jgi:hypothetical protein|tara:strand:+ start:135 stop:275 length:141 start_codon:yes stop_codon:yes gene_type:complete
MKGLFNDPVKLRFKNQNFLKSKKQAFIILLAFDSFLTMTGLKYLTY